MIQIYVVNLATNNNGVFSGAWIELPCDDLQERIDAILDGDEKYAIHDYEAPFRIKKTR